MEAKRKNQQDEKLAKSKDVVKNKKELEAEQNVHDMRVKKEKKKAEKKHSERLASIEDPEERKRVDDEYQAKKEKE